MNPWKKGQHPTQKDTYYYHIPKNEAVLTKDRGRDGGWYLECLPLGLTHKHVGSDGMLEEELFVRAHKILREQFARIQSIMAQFE